MTPFTRRAFVLLAGAALAALLAGCDTFDNPSVPTPTPGTETEEPETLAPVSSIALKDNTVPMVHNGGMHTPEDFARIKAKLAAGAEPWTAGYAKLTGSSRASVYYNANPQVKLIRGGGTVEEPESDNYSNAFNDVAAAYQLALRWKIEEDAVLAAAFADKAVSILNGWASTCVSINGDSNKYLASGIYGYQFAVSGELLRGYSGWTAQDFAAYQQWLLNVFYPLNHDFIVRHNNTYIDHYWANWDLANLVSMLAIGVLCDRRDLYNEALEYMLRTETDPQWAATGNGNWYKAINYIHEMGTSRLGQIQESGRDQGHATLVIALLGVVCQLTWNQGDDFYGLDDYRFLAGCEYTARYNVSGLDVPFHEYTRVWGNTSAAPRYEVHTEVSSGDRGTVRPIWALPYYHYRKVRNLSAAQVTYTYAGVVSTAPEGGGGTNDYGVNSGGFDQLGFGTLLYAR